MNDRFQLEGWTPIELHVEDDFVKSVAAYKQYDVLLVNAIFDGLNLIAKEAPLVNERDGVLILSGEHRGARGTGRWALTVNPFDVSEQATAIHAALEMSPERAPLENRGDSRPRARPRPDRLDRRPARRPRPLGRAGGDQVVTVASPRT